MKFIKWLDKHYYLIMAILAVVGFIGGMVYAHYACDSLEKQQKAEEEPKAAVLVVEQEEQPQTYWESVPLDRPLQEYIAVTSRQYGIAPETILAMCYRESTYDPSNIGDGGESYGLMQVQPKWHSERMERLGVTDLLDPYQNVTVGIDYLCELLSRYDGDVAKALVGYNQGSFKGTVTEYAKDVLETVGDLNAVDR